MRDSPDQVLDVRSLIHAKQVRQIRYVEVGVANALHDAAIVKFVTLAAKLERRNGANPTPIQIRPNRRYAGRLPSGSSPDQLLSETNDEGALVAHPCECCDPSCRQTREQTPEQSVQGELQLARIEVRFTHRTHGHSLDHTL